MIYLSNGQAIAAGAQQTANTIGGNAAPSPPIADGDAGGRQRGPSSLRPAGSSSGGQITGKVDLTATSRSTRGSPRAGTRWRARRVALQHRRPAIGELRVTALPPMVWRLLGAGGDGLAVRQVDHGPRTGLVAGREEHTMARASSMSAGR